MLKLISKLGQRGDTIVEVLIAITVISMTLGGAYVTTNRSIQTARTTEERGNALKLAESQVEQIKSLVETDPAQIFGVTVPANFCVTGDTVYNATAANCKVDLSGAPTTGQPQYQLSTSQSSDTFAVTVKWEQLNGNQGNVEMIYRVHE